jgi:dihydrofolate reductase
VARIVATEFLTLDGVMQAPGDPEEDRTGGFQHGGWQLPYADDVAGRAMAESMAALDGLLFGRRTYEFFAGYWPTAPEDDYLAGESLAAKMNTLPKHVVARTLQEPLAWQNSTLIRDADRGVRALRNGPGRDIAVIGSGELVRFLIQQDLVDEFRLTVDPLILGSGKRLFADGTPVTELRLVDATPSTTGALLLTYRRAKAE